MIIRCSNCGRQVISYDCSNDYVVGKRGFKPRISFRSDEVICHECNKNDLDWEEMMTGETAIARQPFFGE